jgi:aspartate kinase
MIVQNVSTVTTDLEIGEPGGGNRRFTDISFTLPQADGPTAMAALSKVQEKVGFRDLLYDDHVGKVSLIGAGMRSHPGVAAKFFAALGEAGVNIEMISSSEIRVSVVCRDTDLDAAVRAVHAAFDLGSGEPAVVYAGTGR